MFAVFAHFAVKIIADAPVRNMNHEQREQYEHREIDHKNFRGFRVFRGDFPV